MAIETSSQGPARDGQDRHGVSAETKKGMTVPLSPTLRWVVCVLVFTLVYVIGAFCTDQTYRVRVQIRQQHTDVNGIRFFYLDLPSGRAVISVDGNSELAYELTRRTGGRWNLVLEPANLER